MILEQANWMRMNVPMNLPQQEWANVKTKLVNLLSFHTWIYQRNLINQIEDSMLEILVL